MHGRKKDPSFLPVPRVATPGSCMCDSCQVRAQTPPRIQLHIFDGVSSPSGPCSAVTAHQNKSSTDLQLLIQINPASEVSSHHEQASQHAVADDGIAVHLSNERKVEKCHLSVYITNRRISRLWIQGQETQTGQ